MDIIIFIALIAVGAALCLIAGRRRSENTAETERLYRLLEQIENYGRDGDGR